jgi:hypothetical protein
MTQPKPRDTTRMRHLHLTPELYAKLHDRARNWHWKSTSAYVEHELRRLLEMPVEGFERKINPEFKIETIEGHNCVFVRHAGVRYVFRYAQKTAIMALDVMNRLEAHFGQPNGVEADLANNYWRSPIGVKLKFMQRTTKTDAYYIDDPTAVTP